MKTKILITTLLLLGFVHLAQGSIPPYGLQADLELSHGRPLESAGCATGDESHVSFANEGFTNAGAGCRSIKVARYFTTGLGRWSQPEPLLQGVPDESCLNHPQKLNPYIYAINNPFKYVDPDGKDIAFAVDPNGAGGNGHTTLFYQNSEGNWFSYNQGAAGGTASGENNLGYIIGLNAPAGVSIDPVNGPSQGAITIKTNKEQDAQITQSAIKSQESHNSGKSKYNLYSNNCTDAAVDVVNKSGAGLKIPNSAFTIKPKSWFKSLTKWFNKQQESEKQKQKQEVVQ